MASMIPHFRCLNLRQTIIATRNIQLGAARSSNVKNPIQKYGWEYLVRQEKSGRPLSPHITMYAPQLTWYLSGFHRISGCVMAGTLLVGGLGFALTPIDFTTFIEYVRSWNLPTVVTSTLKFIVAFPIIYHSLNGIRFMGFDLAKGTDIKSVYRSGYLVLGASFLLALLIVIDNARNKKAIKV